jgi:hypothetical protein
LQHCSGTTERVHGFVLCAVVWRHAKAAKDYRRGDMREKRRRLMEDWAAYCSGKTVGGSNVVKIGGRK